jgi:HEAT repeat protein
MRDMPTLLADLTSGDDTLAEASALQLAALGEAALPDLTSLLDSAEVDHRWWAVRSLAQCAHPPLGAFLRALDDASGEVRQCAALALASHPDPQAVTALIRALSDPDRMTANLAANALIAIGAESVPGLVETVHNGGQAARLEALRALAEIRDPRAIPVMMNVLEEESVFLQHWAEIGLDNLGLNMVYFKPE